MSKQEKSINLVVSLLQKERKKCIEILKKSSTNKEKNIELKSQLDNAIKNLIFCENHVLSSNNIEIIQLEKKGSEDLFTEYYIIDENDLIHIPKSAIKKDINGREIVLTCFDKLIKIK